MLRTCACLMSVTVLITSATTLSTRVEPASEKVKTGLVDATDFEVQEITGGINNIDFGILKNTRIGENQRIQLRADFFNATNTRNFGIPDGRASSTSGAPNASFSESVEHKRRKPEGHRWLKICFLGQRTAARLALYRQTASFSWRSNRSFNCWTNRSTS
jgi:hypothetical protein